MIIIKNSKEKILTVTERSCAHDAMRFTCARAWIKVSKTILQTERVRRSRERLQCVEWTRVIKLSLIVWWLRLFKYCNCTKTSDINNNWTIYRSIPNAVLGPHTLNTSHFLHALWQLFKRYGTAQRATQARRARREERERSMKEKSRDHKWMRDHPWKWKHGISLIYNSSWWRSGERAANNFQHKFFFREKSNRLRIVK